MQTIQNLYEQAVANPVILYVVAGLISLLLANRSQVDDWANSNPRVAGVMKLVRSLGIDPWMLIQSLSLIVRGRLPEQKKPPQDPPSRSGTGKGEHISLIPPTVLMLCLALLGCSGAQSPIRDAASAALGPASTLCMLAHSRAEKADAQAALRFCSDPSNLEPWAELAAEAYELAQEQLKAAKPTQESATPAPVAEPASTPAPVPSPSPPPPSPSEPAIVPTPNAAEA